MPGKGEDMRQWTKAQLEKLNQLQLPFAGMMVVTADKKHSQPERHRSNDAQFDEVKQLMAWCGLIDVLAKPIDVASQASPTLRGVLIFNAPTSQLDSHGTAVLLLPRVSTGRMPRTVSTWAMRLRDLDWQVVASRGADNAIERLSAMGYG